jgi:hypothetical protein
MPLESRAGILAPRYADGRPMPAEELPGIRALRERRPIHDALYIHGLDGIVRKIEATAIPLETARGHLAGALVVLWAAPAPDLGANPGGRR